MWYIGHSWMMFYMYSGLVSWNTKAEEDTIGYPMEGCKSTVNKRIIRRCRFKNFQRA